MKVRAKMQCAGKTPAPGGATIRLFAVYADSKGARAEENKAFSDATPYGEVSLFIADDKPAGDAFVPGQQYYVDFTAVTEEATGATVEAAIKAKAAAGERVTPQRIEEVIAGADFYVFPGTTLTVCALTLKNGFTVVGESACASPENFDAEIGKRIAREDAKQKIWMLEGYALRERMTA